MGIQNVYKGRGHSVEVQCPCTITLSSPILLLSPFYTFKSVCYKYESKTIQGSSDRGH